MTPMRNHFFEAEFFGCLHVQHRLCVSPIARSVHYFLPNATMESKNPVQPVMFVKPAAAPLPTVPDLKHTLSVVEADSAKVAASFQTLLTSTQTSLKTVRIADLDLFDSVLTSAWITDYCHRWGPNASHESRCQGMKIAHPSQLRAFRVLRRASVPLSKSQSTRRTRT